MTKNKSKTQKIVLITNTFPYSPGEEFLETEVKYWANRDDVKLIIMPKNKTNSLRNVPASITIDHTLIENQYLNKNNFKTLMKVLTSGIFYKELFINHIIHPGILKHIFISTRDFLFYEEILKQYIRKQQKKNILFYSYWHTEACYAIQSLKSDYTNIQIISRIHGFDLYQERREYNYMPLKRQYLDNIDRIYTISYEGKDYVINTYGYDQKRIDVSRLGVEDRNIVTESNELYTFHIVSCSHLTQVKRLDKIIESLYISASKNLHINYIWTHIGDGELYNTLFNLAKEKLDPLSNIQFEFKGNIANKDVYRFYRGNKVDAFINVSESEGAPVTIMEAMSCHIPIVAPDVGGVSSMVLDGTNGSLLSSECNVSDVVNALNNIKFFKSKSIRNNSYNIFLEKYYAKTNYESFLDSLIKSL